VFDVKHNFLFICFWSESFQKWLAGSVVATVPIPYKLETDLELGKGRGFEPLLEHLFLFFVISNHKHLNYCSK
jgi:hypothetical protein